MRPAGSKLENREIADALERVAALLDAQGASTFRVRAYQAAARTVSEVDHSISELARSEGRAALEKLPGIGRSIAALLEEYAATGRVALLERLEGQVSPEDLLTTVPGIGEELAARIHRELGVETLEDLELAAHDGSLEALTRFGPRRVRAIRAAVGDILSRSTRRRARRIRWLETHGREPLVAEFPEPDVATILSVDSEYRRRAAARELRLIAPRRFNPEARAWLPILHTERGGWSFTAMYSNTARAHEWGKTDDWVVIYYDRDGHESQCTVVTEGRGPQRGKRVVRGREAEASARGSGRIGGAVPESRDDPGRLD